MVKGLVTRLEGGGVVGGRLVVPRDLEYMRDAITNNYAYVPKPVNYACVTLRLCNVCGNGCATAR